VDFGGLHGALSAMNYDGWLTVEQDARPTVGFVPLGDAVASLRFLTEIGLARDDRGRKQGIGG